MVFPGLRIENCDAWRGEIGGFPPNARRSCALDGAPACTEPDLHHVPFATLRELAEKTGNSGDEAGDVVRVGFGGGGPVVFAQGLAGDGADGDGGDSVEGKNEAGGVGGICKVGDAGRAGEGGGVDSLLQCGAQLRGCFGRHGIAIGIHNIDNGTGGAERIRDDVAGGGGTGEQDALACNSRGQFRDETLSDVGFWNEGNGEAGSLCFLGCGAADGCHPRRG